VGVDFANAAMEVLQPFNAIGGEREGLKGGEPMNAGGGAQQTRQATTSLHPSQEQKMERANEDFTRHSEIPRPMGIRLRVHIINPGLLLVENARSRNPRTISMRGTFDVGARDLSMTGTDCTI